MSVITKNHIINCLITFYSITGRIPSYRLSSSELGISPSIVRQRFGTWNTALSIANIPLSVDKSKILHNCSCCGIPKLITNKSYNTQQHHFCSKSCAAKFNNPLRYRSDESKEKTSITLKNKVRPINSVYYTLICQECSNSFISKNKFRKTCSTECKKRCISKKVSIWLSINRSHIRGSHVPSYMEHSFEQWLISHNLTYGLSGYLTEVYFYNPITKKNGWADFVFPRFHLIIELDGTHHLKRKELDQIRDEYLNSRSWNVIRITHKEYQNQTRIPEILQLLCLST